MANDSVNYTESKPEESKKRLRMILYCTVIHSLLHACWGEGVAGGGGWLLAGPVLINKACASRYLQITSYNQFRLLLDLFDIDKIYNITFGLTLKLLYSFYTSSCAG